MDDKSYWQNFYAAQRTPFQPSLFAQFLYDNFLHKNAAQTLLELGCGNGWDAVFFQRKNMLVTAIDQANDEIDFLQETHPAIRFVSGDFTQLAHFNFAPFDCIYSRFTWHSINPAGENRLIDDCPKLLNQNGILAIEARGLKNSLFQKGEKVDDNAYIFDGHYRRFVDFDLLCEKLAENFNLEYSEEKNGFAPFEKEDDIFFRIVARKKN